VCPKTGAAHRLVQRPDDNEATVTERLRVYEEKTRPLIDFYRARGLLRVIDAQGDVNEVARRLAEALELPAQPAGPARRKPKKAPRKATGRKAPRKPTARAKVAKPKASARKRPNRGRRKRT
jgi:hypothetical protein